MCRGSLGKSGAAQSRADGQYPRVLSLKAPRPARYDGDSLGQSGLMQHLSQRARVVIRAFTALPKPFPLISGAKVAALAALALACAAPAFAQDPPDPEPAPTLAFASNGNLFTIRADGSDRRQIAEGSGYVGTLAWAGPDRWAAVYDFAQVVTALADPPTVAPPNALLDSSCPHPPTLDVGWVQAAAGLLITQQCPRQPFSQDLRQDAFLAQADTVQPLAHLPRRLDSRIYPDPSGARVAYAANDHIFVADIAGGAPQKITPTPGTYSSADSPLVWSPDGQRIAFFRGTYPRQGVMVIPAAGGTPRLLTPDPTFQIYRSRLAWSPDGRYLALYVPHNPPYSNQEVVTLIEVATGRIIPLTRPGFYSALAWSPDSRQLALAIGNEFAPQSLLAVTLATREFRPLSAEPLQQILAAAWSPDGTWVAYSAAPLAEDTPNQRIYTVRADGSDPRAITAADEYVYPFAWER